MGTDGILSTFSRLSPDLIETAGWLPLAESTASFCVPRSFLHKGVTTLSSGLGFVQIPMLFASVLPAIKNVFSGESTTNDIEQLGNMALMLGVNALFPEAYLLQAGVGVVSQAIHTYLSDEVDKLAWGGVILSCVVAGVMHHKSLQNLHTVQASTKGSQSPSSVHPLPEPPTPSAGGEPPEKLPPLRPQQAKKLKRQIDDALKHLQKVQNQFPDRPITIADYNSGRGALGLSTFSNITIRLVGKHEGVEDEIRALEIFHEWRATGKLEVLTEIDKRIVPLQLKERKPKETPIALKKAPPVVGAMLPTEAIMTKIYMEVWGIERHLRRGDVIERCYDQVARQVVSSRSLQSILNQVFGVSSEATREMFFKNYKEWKRVTGR